MRRKPDQFLKNVRSFLNDSDGGYNSSDVLSSDGSSSDGSMSDGSSGSSDSGPEFVIIKKAGCTYCEDAVELLKNKNKTFDACEREPSKLEKQAMTKANKKDYKYFPKIFHYNKNNELEFIGGFADLKHKFKI